MSCFKEHVRAQAVNQTTCGTGVMDSPLATDHEAAAHPRAVVPRSGRAPACRRRRTKRWEAHIWADKKQVYLGGFTDEARAGAAHDVMAIKCRGKRARPVTFSHEQVSALLPQDTLYSACAEGMTTACYSHEAKGSPLGDSHGDVWRTPPCDAP